MVRRDEERGKFRVLYYRGGQIIAADCVNAPLDFMAVKNALAKGQNIPADAAADPAVATQDHHHGRITASDSYAQDPPMSIMSTPHRHSGRSQPRR